MPRRLLFPAAATLLASVLLLRYATPVPPGALRVAELAAALLCLALLCFSFAPTIPRLLARAFSWSRRVRNAEDTLGRVLSWRVVLAIVGGLGGLAWSVRSRSFPAPGDVPVLDLIAYEDPAFHALIRTWFLVAPALLVAGGLLFATSAWRLWLDSPLVRRPGRGALPPWPAGPQDPNPSLVVGELHHPSEPREVARPQWLTLPERGLYTGIAIFGAVGTGKTSACMRPFATQLLSWQADNSAQRAAGLVLEVKGDFCHDIRAVLERAGRADDYLEIGIGGRWQWNPLASGMDSYSLAYTVATLLNQLFGKSREPFWQQAYTNLIRWLIELHRALPERWCTFQDLYHCAIDKKLIEEKIDRARLFSDPPSTNDILVARDDYVAHAATLRAGGRPWTKGPPDQMRTPSDEDLADRLTALGIRFSVDHPPKRPRSEHAVRLDAIERWYRYDWLQLDPKLRTSIVEGVSVFLSMFDLPEVARVFCPERPRPPTPPPADVPPPPPGLSPTSGAALLAPLPPLDELVEDGKVLALNMPAGSNPALARTIGVMLKNAWLQSLLKRPATMKLHPGRYVRPAVFLCDEYQSFASVGEDDPSGDEKAFALTRQCRVIPIVATQSISSLKSVLPGQDAWRTLLQTLRTKIFLSLSDDSSAELASTMCGKVLRLSPSYSFTESAKPGFSIVTARAGGAKGTLGTSKSYREQREPMFHSRQFALLENCQAIVLPYDGANALPATRVYLKPHYLPRERPYWRARAAGEI